MFSAAETEAGTGNVSGMEKVADFFQGGGGVPELSAGTFDLGSGTTGLTQETEAFVRNLFVDLYSRGWMGGKDRYENRAEEAGKQLLPRGFFKRKSEYLAIAGQTERMTLHDRGYMISA